jgi:biotin-dependent carboxylase-like uncharacterized protein
MAAGLVVEDAGVFTTVQDSGRPGFRAWGVPAGGPFDRASALMANALVANAADHALLELTMRGGVYRALAPLALALAGAPIEARIETPGHLARDLTIPSCFALAEGERLVLGRTHSGIRTYLAVRGGWNTQVRLGSRSTEERLTAGTLLPAAPGATLTRRPDGQIWIGANSAPLRVIAGPDDASDGEDDGVFPGRSFRVAAQSNRMGLRLEGDPISINGDPERLSAPVAPGAIQVAGGQLIILGVAGGTMGGYPHLAHVISADLDRVGQLAPGDRVSFQTIKVDEARALDRESRRESAARIVRISAVAADDIPRLT